MYRIKNLADKMEAAGTTPYSTDYDLWGDWYRRKQAAEKNKEPFTEEAPLVWHKMNLDRALLPENWERDVYDILQEREKVKTAERLAERDKRHMAEIVDFLLKAPEEEHCILRWMVQADLADLREYGCYGAPKRHKDFANMVKPSGGREYKPQAGSSFSLMVDHALYLGSRQYAYDDTSYFAVPFTGYACQIAKNNLNHLLNVARTANGYAGCGYTLSVTEWCEGFVIISQRCSIPD